MLSAFGVHHAISKKAPDKVPDWISGVVPASSANAYNRSSKNKMEAGASNFAVKSGATALGGVAGLGAAALAVKTKKVPKWFLKDTTIKPIKFITKNPTTIKAGEKQRSIATTLGGAAGSVAGGTAAQWHLKRVEKNPRYGVKKESK